MRGNERVLTVNVEGETIMLDLRGLHGQPFDVEQIGGYPNWYRIRNAAHRLFKMACAASGDGWSSVYSASVSAGSGM